MKWIKAGITLLSVYILAVAVGAYDVLDASKFQLKGKPNHYRKLIKKLDKALPNAHVATVIASANHPTPDYHKPEGAKGPEHFMKDFTWDKKSGYNDQGTKKWIPQGITTSSDAYEKGTYGKNDIMLVSWYDPEKDKSKNNGVRISFIDLKTKKYRNVLLVVPHTTPKGKPSFHAAKIHAGGIMWYGDKLYVVDTNNGIRIFDLNHIYEVEKGNKIGLVAKGKYTAHNYRYVIPQMGHYLASSKAAKDFRYSYISLDRTTKPDSLLMGSWDPEENPTTNTGSIVRFYLDFKTRNLDHTRDTTAYAIEHFRMGLQSMQGVTSVNEKYYFSCSRGPNAPGVLYTWKLGEEPKPHTGVLSIGNEDLSYRKQGDELWTLGEHAGNRPVYAIKAGGY